MGGIRKAVAVEKVFDSWQALDLLNTFGDAEAVEDMQIMKALAVVSSVEASWIGEAVDVVYIREALDVVGLYVRIGKAAGIVKVSGAVVNAREASGTVDAVASARPWRTRTPCLPWHRYGLEALGVVSNLLS